MLFEINQKPNLRFKDAFAFALGCLTVCVSGFWAGEKRLEMWKKLEARKMILEAADSQKSAARFVGRFLQKARWRKKEAYA